MPSKPIASWNLFSSKVLSRESLSYQACCPQHRDFSSQVLPENILPGMCLLEHPCYVIPYFCPIPVSLDLLFHSTPGLCTQDSRVGFGPSGSPCQPGGLGLIGKHVTFTTCFSCDFSPQFHHFQDLGLRALHLDGHLHLQDSLCVT